MGTLKILGLWVGFWLVALGVAALLLLIPISQSRFQGSVQLSGFIAGAGAATVLWALRPRWRRRQGDQPRALDRARFPALFAFVNDIARRTGVADPDEVLLLGDMQAFAAVERRWLGLVKRRKVGLGLPLLGVVSPSELGAILAHEMGHHAGGDLALGPWIYRTRGAIAAAVDALEDSAFFLDAPFRAYGRFFLTTSMAHSRQRELAADALSAAVCGPGPAGAALRKVEDLGPLWSAYFELEAAPLLLRGVRIPLLEGFSRFRVLERRRSEVERRILDTRTRAPSPWDSHPSLEERLRALGVSGRPRATAEEAANCLHLLGGAEAAEAAWYEVAVQGTLEATTWEDVAERFVVPAVAQALADTPLDPGHTALEDLPSLVGEGARLWDRLRPRGIDLLSHQAKAQRSRLLLADWLTVALVRRGFRPALEPGAELSLARADLRVEPAQVVAELASGALNAQDYRARCRTWGTPVAP